MSAFRGPLPEGSLPYTRSQTGLSIVDVGSDSEECYDEPKGALHGISRNSSHIPMPGCRSQISPGPGSSAMNPRTRSYTSNYNMNHNQGSGHFNGYQHSPCNIQRDPPFNSPVYGRDRERRQSIIASDYYFDSRASGISRTVSATVPKTQDKLLLSKIYESQYDRNFGPSEPVYVNPSPNSLAKFRKTNISASQGNLVAATNDSQQINYSVLPPSIGALNRVKSLEFLSGKKKDGSAQGGQKKFLHFFCGPEFDATKKKPLFRPP